MLININIEENLKKVKATIPDNVALIAVSKTKPNEDIMAAYKAGQRIFGENKAQEMRTKHEDLPKDIEWHFIGHLQENKIKYIISYVRMIHSIDSLKLLRGVNHRAELINRVVDVLFEMDISHEESKFGLNEEELKAILSSNEYKNMHNVRVCGVMGVGSITDDRDQTRKEFKNLHNIFDNIKKEFFANEYYFKEISMGMSGDYDIAIEEGTTFVRIGSKIFGQRNYAKVND